MDENFEVHTDKVSRLAKLVSEDPGSAKFLSALARQYMNEGMYLAAIEYFLKALEIDKKDFSVYCDIGKTYFKLGDKDSGYHAFQSALQLNPDCIFAMQNLASYYLREEDYLQAKDICKFLITRDKFQPFLFTDLFRQAKKHKDHAFIQELYDVDIPFVKQKMAWSRIYEIINSGEYDLAQKIINEELSSEEINEKSHIRLLCLQSDIQMKREDYVKAKETILQGLEIYPKAYLLYAHLAKYGILTCEFEPTIEKIELFTYKKNKYDILYWRLLLSLYQAKNDIPKIETAYTMIKSICEYKIKHQCKNQEYYKTIYSEYFGSEDCL